LVFSLYATIKMMHGPINISSFGAVPVSNSVSDVLAKKIRPIHEPGVLLTPLNT